MAKTKQKERISIQLKNGASETSPVKIININYIIKFILRKIYCMSVPL